MNRGLHLSVHTFLSLVDVFKANGWEIPSAEAGPESRFKRFCERLSILDNQEQDLVIELTRHFTVISANDYLQFIVGLLNSIHLQNIEIFQRTKKFFILPLLAPQDFDKTKSSNIVWYYFRNEILKYNPVFVEKTLVHCDIKKASWVQNLKKDEAVILVDDYIGSGETAVSAINWLVSTYNVEASQIIILAIAAQKQGIQHIIENTKATVYVHKQFSRGISDRYTGEALETNIQIMNKIEDKLKVENSCRFGYNQSEALISLMRTPNNTFPVFWKPYGKNKIVPFPRD